MNRKSLLNISNIQYSGGFFVLNFRTILNFTPTYVL